MPWAGFGARIQFSAPSKFLEVPSGECRHGRRPNLSRQDQRLTDQKFNDPGLLGWMETPEPPMVFVGERVWTEIGVQKAHFMITENHLELGFPVPNEIDHFEERGPRLMMSPSNTHSSPG